MSLTYYCPSCGGKNIYQLVKPKFCSSCGASMSMSVDIRASSTPSQKQKDSSCESEQKPKFNVSISREQQDLKPAKPTKPTRYTFADDEDEGDEYEGNLDYSSLGGLDVVVRKDSAGGGVSLDDLISNPLTENEKKHTEAAIAASVKSAKSKSPRKKAQKSLPESFVNEASALGRGKSPTEGLPNFE
jgi:hypothetical protein